MSNELLDEDGVALLDEDGEILFDEDYALLLIKFTIDLPRHKMVMVIHDFPLQTGDPANPTSVNIGDVVPYGAYFTGNGAVDTTLAHKDITYYNSDGVSLDIGSGTYSQVSGNIDANEGSISFWFDPDNYAVDTDLFGAATTLMIEWDDSDNDILFTYGSASIRTTTVLSGGQNHIKVGYLASDEITLEINGVAETPVVASTAPTLDSSFTIDSGITEIFCTSDINTPQIPTANGVPLHAPVMEKA